MLILRDYQSAAVYDVRTSYLSGWRAPLLVLPTGGGKTVIFCEIARLASAGGKNVWIIVHRVELLRQTSAALKKSGVNHGLINSRYTPNPSASVQVASVQTLVNRLGHFDPPNLIIIDEAHHATAGSWRKVIEAFPAARVLGVTATPIRGDRRGLGASAGGIFDAMIMGPQIPDLMARGFLVRPRVYAAKKTIDLSEVDVVRGDYDKGQIVELMDRPKITGSAVEHYTELCPGVPCVVFCINVKHAENVAAEFQAAGYRAHSVDGNMDDDQRKRILDGLGNGTVEVVTSCDIVSEGTDIPNIMCGIFLRPTQSTGLYIQQGGRPLRPVYADGYPITTDEERLAAIAASKKPYAIILDHVNNTHEHGMLTEPREWTLEGKKAGRKKKGDEEANILVFTCSKCYLTQIPAPKCADPNCGHVREIKANKILEVDGHLTLITEAHVAEVKAAKRKQVQQARTMEDLEAIAKERGYKRGWAKNVFHSRNKSMF